MVVRASDYVRMNRTEFANAVDALPRLDSVSPDEQKKINDTVNTLKKLHLSLNPLEDLFDEYARHIQSYTELKKSTSIKKSEERKRIVKENAKRIPQLKKQIVVLQKQITVTKKALTPVNEAMLQHQKKMDLFISQMAILDKQMQTNIIISQKKRLQDQIAAVRSVFAKAQEDFQRLTAQEADSRTQIDSINKNISQLQKETEESSAKHAIAEEDKKNITENETLISDIRYLRDSLDKVKGDIYSLENQFNALLADIREQKNDSMTAQKLEQIIQQILPLQESIERL